ncbi:ParB N-terminal domain-containing protein [Roseobacter sp. N2S]|uniref:ParB/RepB/Spo0J family partition protein n=1 Tax=Roseobacter sp. N2S TaxID=2663844 RepID=UPI0028611521|nr:ParB N-terminal domain-containing protein [Roseobacter sp. N2S]MDR6267647.1 ParB family chromosome partitioning protein [Roseobacter sp. N2S]
MARRRWVNTPSADELKALEDGFARETAPDASAPRPPIAQVAGDAARLSDPTPVGQQVVAARDQADAERYRTAQDKGLLVQELQTESILAEEMSRDRLVLNTEEMEELKTSIKTHGLRLPVEVFALKTPKGDAQYGLVSGYRRLQAVRMLAAETGDPKYKVIRALLRQPENVSEAFVAMVEENEIRSDLSHYERGRIAVIAAEQGVFSSADDAVNALFQSASKAKRSKIRSFALLHEGLGDLLAFPTHLSERAGLQIAGAVRAGLTEDLRSALSSGLGVTPKAEWIVLEPVLARAADMERDQSRGGRPRQAAQPHEDTAMQLINGMSITPEKTAAGYAIRFHGDAVNPEIIQTVMLEIRRLLGEA